MSATRRGPCRSPGRRDVGQPARSRPRIGVTPIRTEVGSDRSQREAKASFALRATNDPANVRRIQSSTCGRAMTWRRTPAAKTP